MGGVGQEFVQSELSRSDQGPPRALLEIRRKAGLRNECCMPLLQMLDQLGRSRSVCQPAFLEKPKQYSKLSMCSAAIASALSVASGSLAGNVAVPGRCRTPAASGQLLTPSASHTPVCAA